MRLAVAIFALTCLSALAAERSAPFVVEMIPSPTDGKKCWPRWRFRQAYWQDTLVDKQRGASGMGIATEKELRN